MESAMNTLSLTLCIMVSLRSWSMWTVHGTWQWITVLTLLHAAEHGNVNHLARHMNPGNWKIEPAFSSWRLRCINEGGTLSVAYQHKPSKTKGQMTASLLSHNSEIKIADRPWESLEETHTILHSGWREKLAALTRVHSRQLRSHSTDLWIIWHYMLHERQINHLTLCSLRGGEVLGRVDDQPKWGIITQSFRLLEQCHDFCNGEWICHLNQCTYIKGLQEEQSASLRDTKDPR